MGLFSSRNSPVKTTGWEKLQTKNLFFFLSAGFIAVIAVTAVILLITSNRSSDNRDNESDGIGDQASQTQNAETQAPEVITVPSDSICGLKPQSQAIPTQWPNDVDWKPMGNSEVPTSKIYGGLTKLTGGQFISDFNTCFSRDPMGAVFAAMNYFSSTQGNFTWREFYGYAVDNSGRNPIEDGPGDFGAMKINYTGFRVVKYTDSLATIDLLFESGTDGASTLHLLADYTWKDGDWRMKTIDGAPNNQPESIKYGDIAKTSEYVKVNR